MRKWIVVGSLMVAAIAADARPASAGCFTALADCFQRAANLEGFWYRWAAGLDCELDFIECTRVKLIGD